MIEGRNRLVEEYAETGRLEEGGINALELALTSHIQQKIMLSHDKMMK
jgi:hypothetical protein